MSKIKNKKEERCVSMSENIKPLYMYAGGKAKLIKHYKDVIPQPEKNTKVCRTIFWRGCFVDSLC